VKRPLLRRIPAQTIEAWHLLALPLALFFILPVGMLLLRSAPEDLLASLLKPAVVSAVRVSLQTTFISLIWIVLFGTPLAYLLGRHTFPGKRLLDILVDLPTLLPPSAAGVALLITFGRRGFIGAWLEANGIQVVFTPLAVVLAQVFIAAPFYVRAAALGFSGIDPEIEQAAQLDGANPWQIFRFLSLPLSRQALLSGATTSWARALGEFGATLLFAGNFPGRTQTMPTAIYLGFERDLDSALTLSAILVLISLASLFTVKIALDSPAWRRKTGGAP
jgi:molybdate transport system permease protein